MVHLSIGVGEWNSIIINFHTNCIIYQTFNRLSEYLCRRAVVQFYLHVLPGLVGVLGQCGR